LVTVRPSARYTSVDFAVLIEQMTELVKAAPFGLIYDVRQGQLPNASDRHAMHQFYDAHERKVRENFLAVAIVGTSGLIRGVLTALQWVRPPPHPVRTFATLPEGEAWLLQHFRPALRARALPPAPRG
jgi:hypothetical protein